MRHEIHWMKHCQRSYCSLPNSGRSGQEQPTVRTTSDWSRGRIRPNGWLSCICSAQLFLSGSAKIGETAILNTVVKRWRQRGSVARCYSGAHAIFIPRTTTPRSPVTRRVITPTPPPPKFSSRPLPTPHCPPHLSTMLHLHLSINPPNSPPTCETASITSPTLCAPNGTARGRSK